MYVCVLYVCVCASVCAQIHTWIPWGWNYSGSELPDMGEENQTQVLWKGGKHSQLLSHLSNRNNKLLEVGKPGLKTIKEMWLIRKYEQENEILRHWEKAWKTNPRSQLGPKLY